jgi:hypothetical protein
MVESLAGAIKFYKARFNIWPNEGRVRARHFVQDETEKSGGAGGIRTHEWRFCRPLPWATWVPRRTFEYSKTRTTAGRFRYDMKNCWCLKFKLNKHFARRQLKQVAEAARDLERGQAELFSRLLFPACYFLLTKGESIFASRRNRADSSGGVGLM